MRALRLVLALVFGLVMAGPEVHACPVHDAHLAGAAAHHHAGPHAQHARCTCHPACCPVGIIVAAPAAATWTPLPPPLVWWNLSPNLERFLPARPHVLPFALAPPLLTA